MRRNNDLNINIKAGQIGLVCVDHVADNVRQFCAHFVERFRFGIDTKQTAAVEIEPSGRGPRSGRAGPGQHIRVFSDPYSGAHSAG